jgi:hypothetical protein
MPTAHEEESVSPDLLERLVTEFERVQGYKGSDHHLMARAVINLLVGNEWNAQGKPRQSAASTHTRTFAPRWIRAYVGRATGRTPMSIAIVLLVIALILFLLAAFNVGSTVPVNLGWLGLFFVTLATVLGGAAAIS